MTKRRALGRGLSALIPETPEERAGESGLHMVAVENIVPNPHQPRSSWDEEKLDELAASIKEHGLIQPLIVQQSGENVYTLIAGERRWRAAQRAGLTELPVVVKEATPQSMLELALIENIQRDDLNPVEEATAYRQLMDEFNLTQAEVAQRVGKSRPAVANIVRLLDLPLNIQAAVSEGIISNGHARALLPLPTSEAQTEVMNNVINFELSVRQTENLVKKRLAAARPKPKPKKTMPPEVAALQDQFRQSLGTRVDVQKGAKGQGKVVIHFYSDEELQAIYEAITKDSSL